MFNRKTEKQDILPVVVETITAQTVSITAGAAGTIVETQVQKWPILSSKGSMLGALGDTSLSFGTGTCFTTEVGPGKADADLANGEYWVDYTTGLIRGKKATTATSDTVTYKTLALSLGGLGIRPHDYLALTYVAAGNGTGEIETVVFKTGGSGGTTVTTLTLAYDASNRLSSVTKS